MSGKLNILITGSTGYIGSELVNVLLENTNNNIAVVVRDIKKAESLFEDKVTYITTDNETLKNNINKFSPDIVVHLASYSSSLDTLSDINKLIESNIVFTSVLLDALSDCNLKLFINTGSFSEYYYNNETTSPTYFYSATKTSASCIIEYFSKKNNFKTINAILYTVYGRKSSNKKIIDYAIDSLNSVDSINMSDGKQILDFIHIDDVLNFYTNLIYNFSELNIKEKNYFVGTGRGTSIRDVVQILEEKTGKKANVEWGANKSRHTDTKQAVSNIVKTSEDLVWSAKIDIYTGLKKYIDGILGITSE